MVWTFKKEKGKFNKDRSLTYYDKDERKMKTVTLDKDTNVFNDDLKDADVFNLYFKGKLETFFKNNSDFKQFFVYRQ